MAKLKVNAEELMERAKSKPSRSNYTYRLRTDLMEAFKAKVDKEKVKPTAVLEEFLKAFTGLE